MVYHFHVNTESLPLGHAPTLAESVVLRLRQEIVDGRLMPGTRLAEAAVAKRLGVSRVPVREALAVLEREGLVEFGPTGRAMVKALRPADFEELYTLRLALEPLAARLAALSLAGDAGALRANVEATEKARSVPEVTRLDLDFHEIILAASGNGRLLKLWRSLRGELELWLGRMHRQHQFHTRDTQRETVGAHLLILERFRTGTPEACEKLMREHILGWREWLPLSKP